MPDQVTIDRKPLAVVKEADVVLTFTAYVLADGSIVLSRTPAKVGGDSSVLCKVMDAIREVTPTAVVKNLKGDRVNVPRGSPFVRLREFAEAMFRRVEIGE